jgi:hypothetical protein
MMDRRSFVKFVAALAAGVSALPAQLEAYEKYYEINTPQTSRRLLMVDEVWLSGLATHSIPCRLNIYRDEECVLPLGLNLFGGVVRWVAAADMKIMAIRGELEWDIETTPPEESAVLSPRYLFNGHISYIDDEGVRRSQMLTTLRGSV